ncbi:MAG: hypothetical protein KYX68_13625 [Flavobacterium sp.]|nr:hypothetical protein [Flavobacterium sp.]
MNKKLNVFLDLLLVSALSFILINFYKSTDLEGSSSENLTFGIVILMVVALFFNWYDKLEKKKWVYYAIITGIFVLGLILVYLMNEIQNGY